MTQAQIDSARAKAYGGAGNTIILRNLLKSIHKLIFFV